MEFVVKFDILRNVIEVGEEYSETNFVCFDRVEWSEFVKAINKVDKLIKEQINEQS